MDESDGVLRLALGPSRETGNFNSIVTLQAAGDELVEVGRIDRLGVGEDITSVRWFDGLALLVTFRQVDPLYAVGLTTPRSPWLLGELKIPGFSSYLHPLGPMRVVGSAPALSLVVVQGPSSACSTSPTSPRRAGSTCSPTAPAPGRAPAASRVNSPGCLSSARC